MDGQSLTEFEQAEKNNLYKLWNRLSSGSYRFPPPTHLARSHLLMDDRAIQLDPYPFELFNTIYVYGTNGTVIVLQVVHPSAAPAPRVTGEPSRSTAPNMTGGNHELRPITNHDAMGACADQ
ncbi:hypothetical protein ACIBQ0_37660 [Nocardia nova]|uniref:hypothetical protein n=1 Tax=Nocardia nova TaxID=37330 RepID=UPI003791C500